MSYPPINPEDLARLHELGAAEHNLQQRLYDLELAKIPILAAGKRIREEQDAVYSRIATARGLPPEAVLDINMKTGDVRVAREQGFVEAQPEAEPARV
jgi:hypothetical protein